MSDLDPSLGEGERGEGWASAAIPLAVPASPVVRFNRVELNAILGLYGRRVAEGEWRDYAMDFLKDKAVFSIFRRASEAPLYRVEKDPRLAAKQGAYSVVAPGGYILKRGHDLNQVLRVLDKPVRLIDA